MRCCVTSYSASVNEALFVTRCMWHLNHTMEVMTQHGLLCSQIGLDFFFGFIVTCQEKHAEGGRLPVWVQVRAAVCVWGVRLNVRPASCRVWSAVPAVCSQWPCFLSCASVPRYSLTEPLPTWGIRQHRNSQTERCTVMDDKLLFQMKMQNLVLQKLTKT